MLPGTALNRVGVLISWLFWDELGNAWVGLPHCLPIAEVPSLQLFNNDAIYDGELTASRLTAGGKTDIQGHLFELRLKFFAILVVTVYQDNDFMVCRNPLCISLQARGKVLQELIFILKSAYVELCTAQNHWKYSAQKSFH